MASPSPAPKVLVPIANGTELMEAVITIDVLRRAGADVTVASVEKQLRVDADYGIKIVADALITGCSQTVYDLISLPGGMPGATNFKNCGGIGKFGEEAGRGWAALCSNMCFTCSGTWWMGFTEGTESMRNLVTKAIN